MQSEVLTLERRHLDLASGRLTLRAGETKNDEGREVFLTAALKATLAAQLERVPRGRARRPHGGGEGEAATVAQGESECGLLSMLRHDLRRTAVRNLVRAGVAERVAMELTGHKTRSVFDRYDIVSEADKRAAAERLDLGMF